MYLYPIVIEGLMIYDMNTNFVYILNCMSHSTRNNNETKYYKDRSVKRDTLQDASVIPCNFLVILIGLVKIKFHKQRNIIPLQLDISFF